MESPLISIGVGLPITTVAQLLTFTAAAVRGDNPGGNWLHFPDAGVYIAPYTLGFVIPFTTGVQVARVDLTPPVGQSGTGSGQPARLIWTDAPLAAQPGSVSVPALTQGGLYVVGAQGATDGINKIFLVTAATVPPAGVYDVLFLIASAWVGVGGAYAPGAEFLFAQSGQPVSLFAGVPVPGTVPLVLSPGALRMTLLGAGFPLIGSFFFATIPAAGNVGFWWQATLRAITV